MGLSGVTLAFLALQARLTPEREFGLALGGIIPVRMAAQVALILLLVWSLIGSLARESTVAHSTHLGGLLFGMGYYELWTRRNKLRSISFKAKTMLRQVYKR
jgi:rhomboid-like protein